MSTAQSGRRLLRPGALIAITAAALGVVAFFAVGLAGGQHQKVATIKYVAPKSHGDVVVKGEPGKMTASGEGKENNEIRARDNWFYGQRAFPNKVTPPGALQRAMNQTLALRRSATDRADVVTWSRIGPNPIATIGPDANAASGQFGGSLPLAGRVSAIAPAPSNYNVVYLGGANGGVWKSTNGGASWAPLWPNPNTIAATFSIGAIAVNPSNYNDVWVGTGEANGSGDSYYGQGIYHSTNGGASWIKVGGTTFNGCFISDLAIVNATTVVAGALEFPGVSNPACTIAKRGVWRTTNTGTSWSHLSLPSSTYQAPSDFTQPPGYPSIIYAATYIDGIYRSLNGGATWTKIATTTGYYREAISAYNPSTLYLVGSAGSSSADFGTMYKITTANTTPHFTVLNNGGTTNTPCTYPSSGGGQCWYDLTVAADPKNASYVFVGGIRVYRFTTGGLNAGTPIGYGAGAGNIHVDQHATVFDQGGNMWEGSDGGAYRLPLAYVPGGNHNFVNRNGVGSTALGITEFNGWVSGSVPGGTFIGGTQDNGTVKYTTATGLNWRMDHGGDGGASAFVNANDYFASYYGNNVYRTLNGGTSYTQVFNNADPANFYPPMEQDPGNLNTLYRGTNRIWRTTNDLATTPTWSLISPTWSAHVTAIGVQKATAPTYLYAGIAGTTSQLEYTHNATTTHTWAAGTGVPNRYITDIWVNPANAANAILTVSGFGTGHVYKTINGGVSWTNISGTTLPNVPVNAVTVDPANANKVFLGTDTGVFWTANGTAASPTWVNNSSGLPNTAVTDIVINGSYLVAATHGRSAWRAVKP